MKSAPPSATDPRVGQTLNGKWRVDRLIDVGGMGAVYAATHRNGRRAAIKVLHAHFAHHPEVKSRFLREGYVANRIGHPGAVAVLDDDVAEDGSPFLVMELLEGESLAAWTARSGGRLSVPETLAVAGQVLEVLAAAHKNGVIHRDIKPGNVFVTKTGHAKLLDFGLARIRDAQTSLVPTAVGTVMGTAGYMAPEQARGQQDQVDARSDVFAVGAVVFRTVSGRRIHERATPFDVSLAAMKDPATSLAVVMPAAGHALVAAVDRALAFKKEDRWQSAEEMFHALRRAYEELPGMPVAPPPSHDSAEIPVELASTDAPSLVIDVTFGSQHDDALARERKRTLELIEEMSSLGLVRAPDSKT